jgi:hypothetical protein
VVHRLLPDFLQRRDQRAIAQHRPKHRHRLVGSADAHLGLAEPCAEQGTHRRRLLRHMHLEDRLRRFLPPGAQALQHLHAAQRKRQRARVGRDVLVGGPRVEHGHARLRQRPRGLHRER